MSEEDGESSPPRPKRRVKALVLSSSDSDSDESVGPTHTRRKKLRIVSDNESSDGSGSSVVSGLWRKRTLPNVRDSDDEGQSSGWATDNTDDQKVTPAATKPPTASGFSSDSSEGNSDKCSICLMRFTNQEVGTPQNCEHIFCLDCITEWSKNVNTCPVDRMTFNSIIVRACAGGKVLRTEAVKVIERRPSVEILVTEDPTVCEICGSTDNEECMLLCDGCDLGYHMQCLSPPINEVPINQWFCPNCSNDLDDIQDFIYLSEVDDLFSDIADIDLPLNTRPSVLRQVRNTRRSMRFRNTEEASTSNGQSSGRGPSVEPSTSRGGQAGTSTRRQHTRQRSTKRRGNKRRRTKTVIVGYEVEENGKFPITKRVKRKSKKSRINKKRLPRTAARRSLVRASVRARLAAQGGEGWAPNMGQASSRADLPLLRERAGVPALSLFGDANQLEYFSGEEDHHISEGATTAVAARPNTSIFSAYRQARRKMISIPSPPHASSAPDLLSTILQTQSLLHSKKSVVSIAVDGQVNIQLHKPESATAPQSNFNHTKNNDRVDLSQADDTTRKAPMYPGQSRGGGGGGWGGGYRGNYPRDQGSGNANRGNYDNNYSGGYQGRPGGYQQGNNSWREEGDGYGNQYMQRPHQYSQNDDLPFDRLRRPPGDARRYEPSFARRSAPWSSAPPVVPPHADLSLTAPHRHSFGGFENPLDMRMGQVPQNNVNNNPPESIFRAEAKPPPQPQAYRPLPEPPPFKFRSTEVDKSEDEKSDSGLIIDTEKYDPTEPTHDDDDSGEERALSPPPQPPVAPLASPPPPPLASPPPPPLLDSTPPLPAPPEIGDIMTSIDTTAINVHPNVLDNAVRQVLKEHRNLMIVPPSLQPQDDRSDEESDGDCPNFSIYSAASVHIANASCILPAAPPTPPQPDTMELEDLVQEDDDPLPPADNTDTTELQPLSFQIQDTNNSCKITDTQNISVYDNKSNNESDKTIEEYNLKISKRCPITINTRNPIKIKLNTPSLIKRQVSLYDEEEEASSTAQLADRANITGTADEDRLTNNNPTEKDIACNMEEDNSKFDSTFEMQFENETNLVKLDTHIVDSVAAEISENCTIEKSPPDENVDDLNTNRDKEMESLALENNEKSEDEVQSEDDDTVDNELDIKSHTSKNDTKESNEEDGIEKMTESISETEDERSYTPCLDENKSKDTSMETDKDKALEGLDTEMISEDEGNEMFSEEEAAPSDRSPPLPAPELAAPPGPELEPERDDAKKKKKKDKDGKKEGKDKNKSKKRTDVAFKKPSKNGKERNYRDRDKQEKDKDKSKGKKERRDSSDTGDKERPRRRKEKRKDLERYDVRTVVSEKRRKSKDAFGRDVSPLASPSPPPPPRHSASPPLANLSLSPPPLRRSLSRGGRSPSPRLRRSPSLRVRLSPRLRRSPSPRFRRSPSPRLRRSPSPRLRRSPSPRLRRSPSPRLRRSPSPRLRRTPLPLMRRSPSPRLRRSPTPRARRSSSIRRRVRRIRSTTASSRCASPVPRRGLRSSPAPRKRRRSRSPRRRRDLERSPDPKPKKKKRARSERPSRRRAAPRRKSPRRKKTKRRSPSREPVCVSPPLPAPSGWSPLSVDSRLLSPRTPPDDPAPPGSPMRRRRRDPERLRRRRIRDLAPPSKEVFTSGDNILVSVSFKDQEREAGAGDDVEAERRSRRADAKRERRKRRRRAPGTNDAEASKPVAIIDLERSPFRELTPSPKNVIVLSDSDPGEKETEERPPAPAPEPQREPTFPVGGAGGPKTPPEPAEARAASEPRVEEAGGARETVTGGEDARGPNTPPDPPSSPDAYDPYEPTRSASGSPAPPAPDRPSMTLEAAQKTNLSADEVLDRRPLSPMEKVMALLKSTRDVSPDPPPPPAAQSAPPPAVAVTAQPPAAPPVRIVLPSPTRAAPPKLFLSKPSPIKSTPIKPLQTRPALAAAAALRARFSDGGDSPYSPGSSDFGDLFEPPAGKRDAFDALFGTKSKPRKDKSSVAKVPVKLNRKKGKTQVGVKIDEDNLKILDDLPSSAVEMQVKSKFLKKLNRQERVVEEVKLVLKPHYNKKHVTKDEYKDILRRAVPKICHNKTGEINPTKIQSLVEAYVKKIRKKHKLGLL